MRLNVTLSHEMAALPRLISLCVNKVRIGSVTGWPTWPQQRRNILPAGAVLADTADQTARQHPGGIMAGTGQERSLSAPNDQVTTRADRRLNRRNS
jgi:hypothetical protein